MSYISVQGEQSEDNEVEALTNLTALTSSSATQAIQKTGPTTFANVELNVSGAIWGQLTGTLSDQTDLQTALDLKAPLISPTFATSITGSYLTASEILITNASKNIVSAPVATYPSLTELSYIKGLSSAIQTQLNAKDAILTFGSGLTRTVNAVANNLITGLAGGQTIYGGTAASETLTLSSTSNATKGKILFGTSAYDEVNNRLGIGVSTPSQMLSLSGQSDRAINVERITTADTAGKYLQILAGGATVGATDKNGGDLYLDAGTSTGTGTSRIFLRTVTAGSTGTTDNAQSTKVTILGNGNVGIGIAAPLALLHLFKNANEVSILQGAAAAGITTYKNNAGSVKGYIGYASSGVVFSDVLTNAMVLRGEVAIQLGVGTGADFTISGVGNVGIGTTAPTAVLHLKAGTATASTAPLKFTSGTSLTTAELGAIEFTDPNYFASLTDTTVKRKAFVLDDGARLTSGKIPIASTNGRLVDVTPQTELTDELTTVTFTAPGTPDYAVQDLVQNTGFGFVTKDEGNTVLSVIANLQARVNELETKLVALGLLADAD